MTEIDTAAWPDVVTFRQLDRLTGAVVHTCLAPAFRREDAAFGLRWHVRGPGLGVVPRGGDEIVEPGGRVVVILTAEKAGVETRYVCRCAVKGV